MRVLDMSDSEETGGFADSRHHGHKSSNVFILPKRCAVLRYVRD